MFGFGAFGNMFPDLPGRTFSETYRCYSVTMLGEREAVERGGKIIMPPSALDQLTQLHIQYPMLFKIRNHLTNKETHCGVLEFVADEGRIYMPYWMMQNLFLDQGSLVQVENVSLSVATFAKFQPLSVDFLDITNPKAVLENALRSFACLTIGDVIAIDYNDKIYALSVLETKPGSAVSIIECDMNVDFAPPIGYVEPKAQSHAHDNEEEMDVTDKPPHQFDDNKFRAFSGEGNRLDGKRRNCELTTASSQSSEIKRGIPNYDFQPGTITFIRSTKSSQNDAKNAMSKENPFEAFSGQGQVLKKNSRK